MAPEEGPSLAAVLFTDLVGSTALRARLGEERADELRAIHDGLLTEHIEAHGGRVLKSTGDGLVAAFVSTSNALSAAVESQQALDRYGRRPEAIAALPVRMGLSVGDVSWEGGDCFGTPLVEAARLEAEAQGGQILCSEFVRVMARGRGGHEFRDLGFLQLKGLPEPLATCEVVWAPLDEPESLPLSPELAAEAARPFVSRTAELEVAEALLADPARERVAVLWLLGEPGIGKTRLATEIARRARAAGALVLFGRCNEDLPVPYQPFLEALRFFVDHLSDDELAERLGAFPGELTRLVPELSARMAGLEPTASTSPEIEQHRLFEAIRSWLAAGAGGTRPMVAVLDDVHWAARPTVALLGHVARSAEPSRALLVCTARNTSPDENEALAALVEELERRGTPSRHLDLGGLAVEGVGEMIESAAGRRLDDGLRALAAKVHDETAGNPLFVDALLASLPPDRAWRPGPLPRSVAETVRRRVSRLPPGIQELLRTAAVAGLEFDLRVAAQASGHDETEALGALEGAARAGLVEEVGANRYRFAHALVRSTLRAELSESRRVRVHLRIGEATEAIYTHHLEEHAGELAHHFYEALPAGGAAQAYHYSLLAAARASHLLAHDEAAQTYGRALELVKELEGLDPITRCRLLLAQGEAQGRAGRLSAALATLRAAAEEAAAEEAAAVGASEHLARAAVAPEDLAYRSGASAPHEVELLERAIARLPAEETPLRAVTMAGLSRALEGAGRRAEGIGRGEAALALARRLGEPATTAAALERTIFVYQRIEHAPDMAAHCAELMDVARQIGDDERYVMALTFAAFAAAQLGDLERYDDLLAEFSRLVEQLHQPFWEETLTLHRYFRASLAGNLDLAEQLLEQAKEMAHTHGWDREGMYGVGMFLLRREQGRLSGLAPTLRTLVRLNPRASLWRPGLAAMYVDLGLLAEARAEFEELADGDFAAIPFDGTREFQLALLAEVCCALGDEQRASWLFEHLRPCEGRHLLFSGTAACLGPADRLLGMLASRTGSPDEADRFFERSFELSRRLRSPLWIAHCLYDYAVHLQPREPLRAQPVLAEAAELCRRHGLLGLGRRLPGGLMVDDGV